MIKNIFFFLAISFCAFLIAPTTYACDPLGCLFSGHKQDALILGEVVSEVGDTRDIKIIFVFPQSQVRSLKDGNNIPVGDISKTINFTEEETKTITVGKKYLMSLHKSDNFYIPAWGIYEITGTNYSDAKLVKNKTIDDEALQIFINSGGTEKDFAFYYSGDKPVLIRNVVRPEAPETKEKSIFMIIAIFTASIIWFITAGILFFNPIVDKQYRKEENIPGVRSLPQSAKTIGKILIAIFIQVTLWAYVYSIISPSLIGDKLTKGTIFGLIIVGLKIIPRDIDRLLLTTYPKKRMTIEFVIGIICSFAVGITFGYLL